MPWENSEPQNANLEALRNLFSIENIMDFQLGEDVPTNENMEERKFRFYIIGGNLRLYTKLNGQLYYLQFTT